MIKNNEGKLLQREISDQLRRALVERNLSVAVAAEQLGVSRSALRRTITGESMPSAELLGRIVRQWNVSIQFGGYTPVFKRQLEFQYPDTYEFEGRRVFLCHASEDELPVQKLYSRLRADGFLPWLDCETLLPGQEWDLEIREAVRLSDAVIVCLSRNAVQKSGYVQKEIRIALDVADEKPDGTIFIIPALIEDCDVPTRLRKWHWVDLRTRDAYRKLKSALSRYPAD